MTGHFGWRCRGAGWRATVDPATARRMTGGLLSTHPTGRHRPPSVILRAVAGSTAARRPVPAKRRPKRPVILRAVAGSTPAQAHGIATAAPRALAERNHDGLSPDKTVMFRSACGPGPTARVQAVELSSPHPAMPPRSLLTALAAAALLSACAAGPDYVRPTLAVPDTGRGRGDWKPAEPRPAVQRGLAWWTALRRPDAAAASKGRPSPPTRPSAQAEAALPPGPTTADADPRRASSRRWA